MKGVRKGKGDIIFDESRLLVPRGIRNGLKFPGGFEGFEQRCGGGCDSLTRVMVLVQEGGAYHEG